MALWRIAEQRLPRTQTRPTKDTCLSDMYGARQCFSKAGFRYMIHILQDAHLLANPRDDEWPPGIELPQQPWVPNKRVKWQVNQLGTFTYIYIKLYIYNPILVSKRCSFDQTNNIAVGSRCPTVLVLNTIFLRGCSWASQQLFFFSWEIVDLASKLDPRIGHKLTV